MGLVASQGRLLLLFARKSDLEYRAEIICNRRMRLATQTENLATAYANALSNLTPIPSPIPAVTTTTGTRTTTTTTPTEQHDTYYTADDSAATALYEAQTAILQSADKQYELQLVNIETQQKAVSTEIDSVQKVIDKNIEKSFKVFA